MKNNRSEAAILIIDDEELIRASLRLILEKQGYEVKTAKDALSGLELLHHHPFKAVLLDIRMPGKDGCIMLKEIRQAFPEIRVILITGYGNHAVEDACRSHGAFNFLHKPVKIDELLQKIKQATH
ncbi:response regulator [candidate division CSSED10-310 bacterium]|uniref:Response regulator n=1 Tax=candidate division CSSED10-310 bacterium TaxID=2855610 RepID=A0ABV6YUZ4_UNCC1